MSKSKDLIKKHTESVAHNTLGNIITVVLSLGGAAVMSWFTAHAAFIYGLPLFVVLIVGVAVFFFLALAAYLIDTIIVRRRRLQTGTIDEPKALPEMSLDETTKEALTAQHQSEIARLQDNNTALEIDIDLRRQELNKYAWLHEIANKQAKDIDKYVIVERVLLCDVRLTDPIQIPYVEFWFDIYNMSVYDIVIHKDTIEGRIKFRLTDLLDGKEIIHHLDSIPPSSRVNLTIKQRLSPTEINLISRYGNRSEELESHFSLQGIGITIGGITQFPQVERKRLSLPQHIGIKDSIHNNKVSALEKETEILNARIKELEEEVIKTKPDITGEIKEVFLEEWANGELCRSDPKNMYFDYHFIVKAYLANHGAATTIEQFKLVLKVGERSYNGEKEVHNEEKESEPDWRAWGADTLDDIEKLNDVPLEHTRNGSLWFVVRGVQDTKDKSEMELELNAIDKNGTSYKCLPLPRVKWQRNPFYHKAILEAERARMRGLI